MCKALSLSTYISLSPHKSQHPQNPYLRSVSHQLMDQGQMNHEAVEGGGNSRGGSGCRQSSTRWTPTTDQIRILKELYYNNGVRSPTAEQIQRISARLRQYGKIEGKNVFYWFQNHKARERQKKRFTSDLPTPSNMLPQSSFLNHNNYPLTAPSPPPGSSSTGAGVFLVGQPQGSSYGYGSNISMDKSYRDSCHGHYVEPSSSPCGFFDKRKLMMEDQDQEDDQMMMEGREIETLPLFPMHAEDMIKMNMNNMNFNYYAGAGWYQSSANNDGGSLELTLNSYCYNGRS